MRLGFLGWYGTVRLREILIESLHWEPRVVPSRPSPAVLPTP